MSLDPFQPTGRSARPGVRRILTGLALLLTLPILAAEARKPRAQTPASEEFAQFERDVRPLLERFCYDCHGNGKKKGDLTLDSYRDEASILNNRHVWAKVLQQVRGKEMPPEKKPQPTQDQRDFLTRWIESEIFKADCDTPDPGRVTLRRLNRVEYNNTIRDLVGVKFQPADDFPADDVGYGFDNIGDVLSMPPILLEKYLTAAEKILDAAIVTEDPTAPRKRTLDISKLLTDAGGNARAGNEFILNREGGAWTTFNFPAEGDYILRVQAYGEQAGPDPARMSLALAGRELRRVDVPAVKDQPASYEVRTHITNGTHRIEARFLNNYNNKEAKDPKQRDRNLVLTGMEIEGPFQARPVPLPATHTRIFFKTPNARNQQVVAREILGAFTRRAFRRPVTRNELDRLMHIYEVAGSQGENFEASIKVALGAVLVSPHFLFRGELQPEPDNPRSAHPIDEFALATRLSYFLWSTMPDEELLQLASRNRLRKSLEAQVRRMLQDPRSHALVENFAGQWLQIRNLRVASPDPELFPEYDEHLASDMRTETELFFEHILRQNRSVLDFLDADYTFVNARLARHYGLIPPVGTNSAAFQKVSLAGSPRGGLLGQASILTITSNPTRTSPVKRGKWVLENLLGTPPPPPPPMVPELSEAKEKVLSGTLRQRMEQHREDPNCANCHSRMDPIGFGFENFDAIGAYRRRDGTFGIDPSGKLVSGETFEGPGGLKKILLTSKRQDFLRCLSEKLLTYALGRGLEYYDSCAVDHVVQRLGREGHTFNTLILEVVRSVPFQLRRGEGDRFAVSSSETKPTR